MTPPHETSNTAAWIGFAGIVIVAYVSGLYSQRTNRDTLKWNDRKERTAAEMQAETKSEELQNERFISMSAQYESQINGMSVRFENRLNTLEHRVATLETEKDAERRLRMAKEDDLHDCENERDMDRVALKIANERAGIAIAERDAMQIKLTAIERGCP